MSRKGTELGIRDPQTRNFTEAEGLAGWYPLFLSEPPIFLSVEVGAVSSRSVSVILESGYVRSPWRGAQPLAGAAGATGAAKFGSSLLSALKIDEALSPKHTHMLTQAD